MDLPFQTRSVDQYLAIDLITILPPAEVEVSSLERLPTFGNFRNTDGFRVPCASLAHSTLCRMNALPTSGGAGIQKRLKPPRGAAKILRFPVARAAGGVPGRTNLYSAEPGRCRAKTMKSVVIGCWRQMRRPRLQHYMAVPSAAAPTDRLRCFSSWRKFMLIAYATRSGDDFSPDQKSAAFISVAAWIWRT